MATLDDAWPDLTDASGQPLLADVQALPSSIPNKTLDRVFAVAQALGETADAYTTGTAANQALVRTAGLLQFTLGAAVPAYEAALDAASLTSPAGVLATVTTAGNLAGAIAALVDTINTQTVLARP